MKCFVDTNVLVYKTDRTDPSKQMKAQAWLAAAIRSDALVLSAQSLREFYFAALKKDRSHSAVLRLRAEISALDAYIPDRLRQDRLSEAWALQDRQRIGFWDAMLVASALAVGCTTFLSEDMNPGQKIESLTIINPFTTTPDAVLGAT